jgi:hypothetical protein
MNYYQSQDYYNRVRSLLQDLVPPFRYSDQTVMDALNSAIGEISRVRPDVFLDLKYQRPLPKKGSLDDGIPGLYTVSGITPITPGNTTPSNSSSPIVSIPGSLFMPTLWYMSSYCQFIDVDDTQDVRAQSFSQKFIGSLIQLAA